MQNQIVLVLSYSLIIMVFCGCENKADIETRRQFAIERAHQDFKSRSLIFRHFGTNILSTLMSANANNLKTPRLASSAMGRDQDGEYRLYVFWLEKAPSVDGVEMRLNKSNLTTIFVISSSDKEQNLKASEVSVVMAASWIVTSANSQWNTLETIDDVSDLKVRLLRGNVAITEWCPVSFYRLDRWMGSKEVAEITNQPTKLEHHHPTEN